MNDEVEKIPELFYDVIARIVPGMSVLGLYAIHDAQRFQTIGSVLFGLVFGYLLGHCLELISGLFVDRFLWHPFLRIMQRRGKLMEIWPQDRLWAWIKEPSSKQYALRLKWMAERVVFRSLVFAAMVMLVWPPEVLDSHYWVIVAVLPILVYSLFRRTQNISNLAIASQDEANTA